MSVATMKNPSSSLAKMKTPIGSGESSSAIGSAALASSVIGSWYSGRSVLITGGTGFLGGVLVEKLMRCCPGLDKCYLLIRDKPGMDASARLKKMVKSELFAAHDPLTLSKLVAVSGDVSSDGLGICPSDRAVLLESVSVVFHSAASINFNAALASAVDTNLLGTKRVMDLCHQMNNIQALVYVSTAYCNCTRDKLIEETVYPTHVTPDYVIDKMAAMTSKEFNKLGKTMIGKHPNTYSFTKLLAENLVASSRGAIPVAIVRPTIVLSTLSQPFPGWVDNVSNGAFAFIAGASRGIFRVVVASADKVADFVPADHVASLMVASAWTQARRRDLQVLHCSSGLANPLTWGQYVDTAIRLVREDPCDVMFWYPGAKLRAQQWRTDLALLLLHVIPAHVAETACKLLGRKMILSLLSIQQKYSRAQNHVKFFTHNEWQFDTSATQRLTETLTTADKQIYQFDMAPVVWETFFRANVFGLRNIFHKETPKTLHQARRKLRWWKLLNDAAYLALMFVVYSLTYCITGDVMVSVILALLVTLFMIWL